MVATGKLTPEAGVVEARGQGLPALRELLEWATVSQLLDGVGDTIQLKPQPVSSQAASPVVSRYRDAYRVGAALVTLGKVIQKAGPALGAIIFLVMANSFLGATLAFALGAFVGGLLWVFGVIVSAQGQILQASLDNAVANSPFLTNPERAEAMRLPRHVGEKAERG